MLSTYTYPRYPFVRPPELDGATPARRPVVVVGAGPVGLAAAIDLAQLGLPVLLLDDDDTVSVGSRGLCYAKRALEVLDRLGVGQAVVDKGVTWNVGRTFCDTDEVFHFNLLPEAGHERPGMVNLQQYYLEEFLVRRAAELPGIELRWKSQVTQVAPHGQGATLRVETPAGGYTVEAEWLIVADGARSPIRRQLGLEIEGQVFRDRFLIADVVMKAPSPVTGAWAGEAPPRGQQEAAGPGQGADGFPPERWFWFDPPFHRGQSVLLHREADNVWRIDFQLGWDADPEEEKKPENVMPRIRAMLGEKHDVDLEWVSVYTFQCRRMPSFRHGRVLFAGDAAHQVSPFGARGANSGLQDVDNLGWKLKCVIDGVAPEALLDSYTEERGAAADENLLNSTRSTDFITPKSATSMLFRQAVLGLARDHAFARALVNSGRLSVPAHLSGSSLNTPDAEPFEGWMAPGAPLDDAPLIRNGQATWLLRQVGGGADGHFTLLVFGDAPVVLPATPVPVQLLRLKTPGSPVVAGELIDAEGHASRRLDARPGTTYLIRPDQHVAARWRRFDAAQLQAALQRCLCLN